MNVLNISNDYDGFTKIPQIKDDENDENIIILKLLLLSNPNSEKWLSLVVLMIWIRLKPVFPYQLKIEKFFFPHTSVS